MSKWKNMSTDRQASVILGLFALTILSLVVIILAAFAVGLWVDAIKAFGRL